MNTHELIYTNTKSVLISLHNLLHFTVNTWQKDRNSNEVKVHMEKKPSEMQLSTLPLPLCKSVFESQFLQYI